MRCWKNTADRQQANQRRRGLAGLAAALCLSAQLAIAAGGIEVIDAQLAPGEAAYRLDADFQITLPPEIEDLINRGIAVHFALSFDLIRERKYWFNRTVSEQRREIRLIYHPITRSYRVSTGLLHQSFDTLDAALRSIARVRGWAVAELAAVNPRKVYRATLRLELDRGLLPRPFQLQVIATDAWTLDSGEYHWDYHRGAEQ